MRSPLVEQGRKGFTGVTRLLALLWVLGPALAFAQAESVGILAAPDKLSSGNRYALTLSYSTLQERDLLVNLIHPSDGFRWHGGTVQALPAGDGSVTVEVLIENDPAPATDYQWDVILVPTGADYTQSIAWETLAVEVVAKLTYEGWKASVFTSDERADIDRSGPLADLDGDGLSNALEYALGGDPRQSERNLLQTVEESSEGERYLGYRFQRPPERDKFAIVAEGSSDLLSWSSETSTVSTRSDWSSPGLEQVTVRNEQPLSSGPSYLRLRLMELPPVSLPSASTVFLAPSATFGSGLINESSGLVKSNSGDFYWTHNDSGDSNRLFAVRRDGSLIQPAGVSNYQGLFINGASHRDWEDIARDGNGNLIVGDVGNNANNRQDLAVYILPEPDPTQDTSVSGAQRIRYHYPDQVDFPPAANNFDCEAIFWAQGKLYFLTKHRANTRTKLYRMDQDSPSVSNPLTLLDEFAIDGMVTAADALVDGSKLAVLTYNNIWIFEPLHGSDDFFGGRVWWLPIQASQDEAICFIDDDTLLISNEQGQLYELDQSELIRVR